MSVTRSSEVDRARRRFEEQMGELRGALGSETGRRPRSRGWTLLWVAVAAGFAFAAGRRLVGAARGRRELGPD